MLDELLKDEELGRIMFAEFLNQNGCNTGVDTEKAFEDWRCRCIPVPPEQLAQLEPDEKKVILKDVLDKEDDIMEDIPTSIRELEEKGKDEPMVTLAELEERQLKNGELKKGIHDERLAEPDYYAGNGLSPLEAFKKGLLSREETIGFIKGNIIKYVTRAGHKYNASEDMVKAIDYCGHLKRIYEDEMILNARNPSQKEKEAMRIFQKAIEGLNKIEDVEPRI